MDKLTVTIWDAAKGEERRIVGWLRPRISTHPLVAVGAALATGVVLGGWLF